MKNLMRTVLPLSALLFSFFILKAEGTKEVMPTSTNGVALYMSTTSSTGPYRGATADHHIRFYIANHVTENFYFGYRAYNRTPAEVQIYYRIVNAAGIEIVAPTALPTTAGSAGRITSYAQAVAGPNIGGLVPAGYTPRLFNPTANGEYYIELYQSTDGGVSASAQQTLLTWFDFTVATTANVRYPGRVYSQGWNFITYNTTTLEGDPAKPLESDFYGLTSDSTIAKIDFAAGFKPLAFTIYFNKYGVTNTSNFPVDRRSVNTGGTAPSLSNGYPVFLNSPDATLFPRSSVPAAPVIKKFYGCSGNYFVAYSTSAPGDIALLLDLNGTTGYQAGSADRYLFAYDVPAGSNVLAWDGLNGLGAAVTATNVTATLYLRRGRTNLPMYDAELNQTGLTVLGVEPASYTPKLFWDDASLISIGTTCTSTTDNNNTTGAGINNSIVGMSSPGRAWDGPGAGIAVPAPTGTGGSLTSNLCDDYGNARTLNTWFWTNEIPSVPGTFALPSCDSDGDGISNTTDIDDDNDGILDTVESGGINPQGDADSDGIPNYLDPSLSGYTDTNNDGVNDAYDKDGDGVINGLDKDSDNDGIPDLVEAGGIDTNGDGRVDYTGTFASNDSDADGLVNRYDATAIANLDSDNDGVPNYLDLDSDNDGIPDVAEVGGVDANGDGRLDNYADTDNDGFDDTVDGDVGNDGTAENTAKALLVTGADGTTVDGKPDTYPQSINNTDGRGFPNPYDLDSDDDGIADITESGSTDSDNNGKADVLTDTDGDGFADARDGDVGNDGTAENTANALLATGTDADNNGKADSYLAADNADGSGMPNPYDLDSDDDSIPDLIESGGVDNNGDGRIDTVSDVDGNGWQASYDPTQSGINIKTLDANGTPIGGAVFDFDSDGVPNYIDLDSDNDGIPDILEQEGTDSDNNGKVDATTDADGDGFMDTVDPLHNATGTTLGTAIITTGSTLSTQNLPTTYSTGDNMDGKGLINMLDLDSDDDGLLDVREAGLTDATNDGTADGTLGTDGWSDTVDALSSLNLPNTDGNGKANYLDIDADDDGIVDNTEAQTTTGYIVPAGTDSDADGIDDAYDNNDAAFAGNAANGITPANTDGDATADYTDTDSDNDGYPDFVEGHDASGNNVPDAGSPAANGISGGTADADADGLLDGYDNNTASTIATNGTVPTDYPNADGGTSQRDWREVSDNDKDGIADNTDQDDDNDGISDLVEAGNANLLGDADSDGIPNYLDATPGAGVPSFTDSNSDGLNDAYDYEKDGILNALDLDSDNDGIADLVEASGIDTNGDGRVDYTGTFASNDSDSDGWINRYDTGTLGGVAIGSLDSDGDGVRNVFDLDSDNDGVPDVIEAAGADTNNDGRHDAAADTDGDGWADTVDGDVGNDGTAENAANALIVTGSDTNSDGKADTYVKGDFDSDNKANPYDLDSDGDGALDVREAGLNTYDTNNNGLLNSSDAGFADANGDGWADAVDALSSLSLINTDNGGKPDYLDIDSDDDGITDNVEDQSTLSYLPPLGIDLDKDGIDDVYDNNALSFGGSANNGITPVNTDGADLPDYRDTDSDNDTDPDMVEGNDLNINHAADDIPVSIPATDTDGDGLLDFFENSVNNGPIVTILGFGDSGTGGKSTAQKTIAAALERDWRNASFSLSAFTLLPVEFVTVAAAAQANAIVVSWTVAAEQDVQHYVVERSADGGPYAAIGTVAYKIPTTSINEYRFVDKSLSGRKVYYRVRQVDMDGSFTLSKVVAVQMNPSVTTLSLYPNPVQAASRIHLTAAAAQDVTLRITDLQGRVLVQQTIPVQSGQNVWAPVAIQQLPAGTYMLSAMIDRKLYATKFIKQ